VTDLQLDRQSGSATGTASAPNIITLSGLSGGATGTLTGRLAVAPQLGPLQDNGGGTQTMAPSVNSPAVGAGAPAICLNAPVAGIDQRASPRAGTCCTLGAFEAKCLGTACGADQECLTGFCTDGVCCFSACGGNNPGDCQACSAASGALADGTCTILPAATVCRPSAVEGDPAEMCSGDNVDCPIDVPSSNRSTNHLAGGGLTAGCAMTTSRSAPVGGLLAAGFLLALFVLRRRRA